MEQKIKQEFLKLLSQLAIEGRPKHSIEECLHAYTRKELRDIAMCYKYEDTQMSDKQLVDALLPLIQENFSGNLHTEDPHKMKRLVELQGKELAADLEESISLVTEYLPCRYKGWLYFFQAKGSGSFYIVLPDELRKEAEELLNNEAQVAAIIRKRNLWRAVKALVNIYGICEKEQFCRVWEENYGEEVAAEELEVFFQEVSSETELFEVKQDVLLIKGMPGDDAYKTIWKMVKDQPYYMPSKEELERYENESVDIASEPYIKLEAYVKKKLEEPNAAGYMLFQLGMCSAVDAGPESAVAVANGAGVEFEHILDVNTFSQLYCDLANSSPSWILRGFTPNALGCAQMFQSTEVPPGTKLKTKKIGRNDPCPCGSGKKYKKCCGK